MVTESKYQQLWDQYDTGEDDELLLTKYNLCHDMLYSVNDEKRKKLIQLEWNLHSFYFSIHNFLENENGFKLSDIEPYVQKFKELSDENTIDYYKKRFESTPSMLNKSRYAFGCWFLTNESKYLEESIRLILYSTNDSKRKTPDKVHFLRTACNLSILYNMDKYFDEISTLAIKFFFNFINTENVGWVVRPILVFVKLNKSADFNLINNMISNLHKEAHRYFLKGEHHSQQLLLETSVPLVNLTNLSNSLKEQLKVKINTMIAESQENDAYTRWKKDEAMGAVWCFEKAKKIYEKIGRKDKVAEISENIRKATQDIPWKEIKTEYTMPSLKLDGTTGNELVNSICKYSEKIPNYDRIEKQAKDLISSNPIQNLFSKTTFNKKNPVAHESADDSHLKPEIRRLTIMHIRLAENRLSLAVQKLEEENSISAKDFIKFFEYVGLHDKEQLPILKSGIENHFRGDHIASIHTLIPQIEGTLRLALNKHDVSTLKTKRNEIMDNELGGILNKPEVYEFLGVNLTHYLKTKYADPVGLNQRNEVSHALASISEFNYPNSLSIIHDLMILSSLY